MSFQVFEFPVRVLRSEDCDGIEGRVWGSGFIVVYYSLMLRVYPKPSTLRPKPCFRLLML